MYTSRDVAPRKVRARRRLFRVRPAAHDVRWVPNTGMGQCEAVRRQLAALDRSTAEWNGRFERNAAAR